MQPVYHITSNDEYEQAKATEYYFPQSFADEGFIHCSYRHQILKVATSLTQGGTGGLVLLEIDKSKVSSEIIDENLEGGQELFPHIYGPLPIDAVITVKPFAVCND